MKITIQAGRAKGTVKAPPSKSMAHRLLICAGLSAGESVIHGISDSFDMRATAACLTALGADCRIENGTAYIKGIDATRAKPLSSLLCNESGSTLRFFVPIALLSGSNVLLEGAPSLFRRPMEVYETLCAERGLFYSKDERSLAVRGPLTAGEYRVKGNISSQFISGLLFALPLLEGDSTVLITPPVESRSYIGLTVEALKSFGVEVFWQDDHTLRVPGGQRYHATETAVEGDYSNAAFFAALTALGGEVSVEGLSEDSLQGDKVYERLFPMLLRGTPTIHIGDCPDLGPILLAVAAVKNGAVFTGTARLKIKESDRAEAMASELRKLGATVTVKEDSIVVYPSDFHAPSEPLCGHNDHRIVMSMAVLATLTGGTVEGAEAVAKSFPDFFDKLKSLGIVLSQSED